MVWNIWNGFVGFLESVLLTFDSWLGNGGLAIILFTILARVVILPLTLKSLQSTRKMQELQPQIKEIQRKYGKEPQKLQEETAKLYREFRVNPLGGCLPMVLQLPIFFGVYRAVINLTQVTVAEYSAGAIINVLRQVGVNAASLPQLGSTQLTGPFLWISDLGQPDPYYILGVLSLIFQLIVQLMAMPRVQDAQQKAMSQSMLILPLMFAYIGFTFPSGAVLYWVVGSILSMLQQYVISGWGSLANYLKFLPPDAGLFPPAKPAVVGGNGSAEDVEATPKLSFWDVLRPLTEQESSATAEMSEDATATEQALSDVRRQVGQQVNPRRRKARR